MRDAYFYQSLFSTLLIYCGIVISLATFVAFTGSAGLIFIVITPGLLFMYYYKCFHRIRNFWKRKPN